MRPSIAKEKAKAGQEATMVLKIGLDVMNPCTNAMRQKHTSQKLVRMTGKKMSRMHGMQMAHGI